MRIPCIPVWIKAMLTAVILVLLVKTFAFTSCTIPSTGMENSLYQGERVLVNKWSYGFRVPFSIWRWLGKTAGKGDIVLFNNPNPRSPQTSVGNREVFISRVVGVPGDTLMLNDELENRRIRRIFLYRAAFIVGRGLLWGNLAAGLLCWLQARFHLLRLDPAGYMLSEVPVAVSAGWWLAVDVAAAGAILALLLVPAAFVARIRPDEAIKTD